MAPSMMGRRLLSRLLTTTKGRVLLIWNWAALRFEGVKQSSMASQHAVFLAAGNPCKLRSASRIDRSRHFGPNSCQAFRAKCRNLRPIENKGLEFLRWLGRWLWCDNNHHQIALFVWHHVGHEHLPTQPPRIANAVRRSIRHNQKKRVCCRFAADAATSDNRRNSGLYLLKRAVPDTNRGSPRRSRTARRDRRGCGRGRRGNI
jgi:hypothetical protein